MPFDHSFQRLDDKKRGDFLVLQHGLGRVAEPQPPNDDVKSMLGKFRQPQPGQSDLRCREQTRHQKFVAKFDLKDIHTELQLATPAQTQRPNRCWAIV
jgi:hypothetical protein